MNQITFGAKRSYTDFGALLTGQTIGYPEPKTYTVDVPGRDGILDVSDAFGHIHFNNRTLTFAFTERRQQGVSSMLTALHGQRLKIWVPEDREHYYLGRCTVGDLSYRRGAASWSVTVDADPYRYKNEPTTVTAVIAEAGTEIALVNEQRPVCPTITCTSEVQLAWGDHTAALAAGTHFLPDLELGEGETLLRITGSGTVTIVYQEASL